MSLVIVFFMAIGIAVAWIYFVLDAWVTLLIWSMKLFERGREKLKGSVLNKADGILSYVLGWICIALFLTMTFAFFYAIYIALFG